MRFADASERAVNLPALTGFDRALEVAVSRQ